MALNYTQPYYEDTGYEDWYYDDASYLEPAPAPAPTTTTEPAATTSDPYNGWNVTEGMATDPSGNTYMLLNNGMWLGPDGTSLYGSNPWEAPPYTITSDGNVHTVTMADGTSYQVTGDLAQIEPLVAMYPDQPNEVLGTLEANLQAAGTGDWGDVIGEAADTVMEPVMEVADTLGGIVDQYIPDTLEGALGLFATFFGGDIIRVLANAMEVPMWQASGIFGGALSAAQGGDPLAGALLSAAGSAAIPQIASATGLTNAQASTLFNTALTTAMGGDATLSLAMGAAKSIPDLYNSFSDAYNASQFADITPELQMAQEPQPLYQDVDEAFAEATPEMQMAQEPQPSYVDPEVALAQPEPAPEPTPQVQIAEAAPLPEQPYTAPYVEPYVPPQEPVTQPTLPPEQVVSISEPTPPPEEPYVYTPPPVTAPTLPPERVVSITEPRPPEEEPYVEPAAAQAPPPERVVVSSPPYQEETPERVVISSPPYQEEPTTTTTPEPTPTTDTSIPYYRPVVDYGSQLASGLRGGGSGGAGGTGMSYQRESIAENESPGNFLGAAEDAAFNNFISEQGAARLNKAKQMAAQLRFGKQASPFGFGA